MPIPHGGTLVASADGTAGSGNFAWSVTISGQIVATNLLPVGWNVGYAGSVSSTQVNLAVAAPNNPSLLGASVMVSYTDSHIVMASFTDQVSSSTGPAVSLLPGPAPAPPPLVSGP